MRNINWTLNPDQTFRGQSKSNLNLKIAAIKVTAPYSWLFFLIVIIIFFLFENENPLKYSNTPRNGYAKQQYCMPIIIYIFENIL